MKSAVQVTRKMRKRVFGTSEKVFNRREMTWEKFCGAVFFPSELLVSSRTEKRATHFVWTNTKLVAVFLNWTSSCSPKLMSLLFKLDFWKVLRRWQSNSQRWNWAKLSVAVYQEETVNATMFVFITSIMTETCMHSTPSQMLNWIKCHFRVERAPRKVLVLTVEISFTAGNEASKKESDQTLKL